jgi:hypothetical protein
MNGPVCRWESLLKEAGNAEPVLGPQGRSRSLSQDRPVHGYPRSGWAGGSRPPGADPLTGDSHLLLLDTADSPWVTGERWVGEGGRG